MNPALTPEEWSLLCVQGECRADECWVLCQGWNLVPSDDDDGDRRVEPPFHKLAAIALHDQPFGFTRDDVAQLRGDASILSALGLDAEHTGPLTELADRIEALLPPETPADAALAKERRAQANEAERIRLMEENDE